MLLSRFRSVMQVTTYLNKDMPTDMPPCSKSNLCDQPILHDDPLLKAPSPCTTAGISSQRRSWLTITTHALSAHTGRQGVVGLSRNLSDTVSSTLRAILFREIFDTSRPCLSRRYYVANRGENLHIETFVNVLEVTTVQSTSTCFSFFCGQGFPHDVSLETGAHHYRWAHGAMCYTLVTCIAECSIVC